MPKKKTAYDKDKDVFLKKIEKRYREMVEYLLLELTFNPDNPHAIKQQEIMRQVAYWIKELDKDIGKDLEHLIKKAFREGVAYHRLSVKDVTSWDEVIKGATFNSIATGTVMALYRDSYKDILAATKNTKASVKKLIRETVSKVAQYHSITNEKYKTQSDQLLKELSKKGLSKTISEKGFTGVIDKAGRRWDLKTYTKMVIKTKVNDAFSAGVIHEAKESGIDLAVISDHGADDACSKWEGVVISMTGATKGYPTYKEAKASKQIFHPNCEHKIDPIRSVELLHPDDIKKSAKKTAKLNKK